MVGAPQLPSFVGQTGDFPSNERAMERVLREGEAEAEGVLMDRGL